jgi:alpha-mannosidase
MAQLADRIASGPNSLIVFNTLSWKRDGTVSLDLNKGEEIADSKAGAALPMEILDARKDENRVRFMAGIFRLSAIAFTQSGKRRE